MSEKHVSSPFVPYLDKLSHDNGTVEVDVLSKGQHFPFSRTKEKDRSMYGIVPRYHNFPNSSWYRTGLPLAETADSQR